MADEWLRADQVAATLERVEAARNHWERGTWAGHSERLAVETQLIARDVPALAAQDGRWRALVEELLDAFSAAGPREVSDAVTARWAGYGADVFASPRTRRAFDAVKAAQAALDGDVSGEKG